MYRRGVVESETDYQDAAGNHLAVRQEMLRKMLGLQPLSDHERQIQVTDYMTLLALAAGGAILLFPLHAVVLPASLVSILLIPK